MGQKKNFMVGKTKKPQILKKQQEKLNFIHFKQSYSKKVKKLDSLYLSSGKSQLKWSDSFHSDPVCIKLVNLFMRDGKKTKAERIVKNTILKIDQEYPNKAFHILYKAILNSSITVGVRKKSRQTTGKKSFKQKIRYSPRLLKENDMLTQGIRSIMQATVKRSWAISLEENLKNELINCAKGCSSSVTFANQSINLAYKNRYNLHYRWVVNY